MQKEALAMATDKVRKPTPNEALDLWFEMSFQEIVSAFRSYVELIDGEYGGDVINWLRTLRLSLAQITVAGLALGTPDSDQEYLETDLNHAWSEQCDVRRLS